VNTEVYSGTLNGVDVEGQDVDLTVILTLHSYVTCQTGVCACGYVYEYPLNTKVSVLNPYITGLKRKVNNYMEQMSAIDGFDVFMV
jgi:maleate cis-trans isomerase